MNLNDVAKNNEVKQEKIEKEEVINDNKTNNVQANNTEELKKEDTEDKSSEREALKQLEEAVLRLKLKNKIEELEEKSAKLTKLLDKFANNIPIFIERLDTINKGLKLTEFSYVLKNIERNSTVLSSKIDEFINIDKNIALNQSKNFEKCLSEISNTSKDSIERKGKFYKKLNKSLFYMIGLLLVINLGTVYLSNKRIVELEKRIERTNIQNDTIYKLLVNNEKFWINKEDQQLYLKK